MPAIRYGEWARRMEWHVPIDDRSYVAFSILSARPAEEAERIRRNPKPGRDDPEFHRYVVEQATAILEGKRTVDEVTRALIDQPDPQGGIVSPVQDPRDQPIQDWVAQVGQMSPDTRLEPQDWHLGRSDIGLTFKREIWRRELRALAEGRPLKQWCPLPPDWNEEQATQRPKS